MNFNRIGHKLIIGSLFLLVAIPAHALKAADPNKWEFEGAVYLWGSEVDVRPLGGPTTTITFDDLINNLDMAFMGLFSVRKGKWSVFSDVIYLNVSTTEKTTIPVGPFNVPAKIDFGIESWVITSGGGYTAVQTDKFRLDVIAGARYLWLKTPTKIKTNFSKTSSSPSGHNWDGVVGVRGVYDLSDKWYLSYYLDAGAGDSKSTWQAIGGVNYRLKNVDLAAGYRYLNWNIDGKSLDDLTLKGPYAGIRYAF